MGRNKKFCNKYKKIAGKDQKNNKKYHEHHARTSDVHVWETHFLAFQKKMESYGLYLKDIKGDGNCLFRSIADQLEGNEGNYRNYRELAVDKLKEDKEFFQHFIPDTMTFDKYISLVSTDGVWGGNMELQALSKVLGVNFVIHMIDRPPMIMSNEHFDPQFDENGGIRYLHIAYHYGENIGEHYSSVRNINDLEGPAQTVKFNLLELMASGENIQEFYEEYQENEENLKNGSEGKYKFGDDEEFKMVEKDDLNEKMDKLMISEEKNQSSLKQKNKKDYPRNKKCFCGSKKAYKNCCLPKVEKEEKKENDDEDKKDKGKKNNHLLILV